MATRPEADGTYRMNSGTPFQNFKIKSLLQRFLLKYRRYLRCDQSFRPDAILPY